MNTEQKPKTHPCQKNDPVFRVGSFAFYPECHRDHADCGRIKHEHGTKGSQVRFNIGGPQTNKVPRGETFGHYIIGGP